MADASAAIGDAPADAPGDARAALGDAEEGVGVAWLCVPSTRPSPIRFSACATCLRRPSAGLRAYSEPLRERSQATMASASSSVAEVPPVVRCQSWIMYASFGSADPRACLLIARVTRRTMDCVCTKYASLTFCFLGTYLYKTTHFCSSRICTLRRLRPQCDEMQGPSSSTGPASAPLPSGWRRRRPRDASHPDYETDNADADSSSAEQMLDTLNLTEQANPAPLAPAGDAAKQNRRLQQRRSKRMKLVDLETTTQHCNNDAQDDGMFAQVALAEDNDENGDAGT